MRTDGSADAVLKGNAVDGIAEKLFQRAMMVKSSTDPRDGDGDGRIFDGTPNEQAAVDRRKVEESVAGVLLESLYDGDDSY